jgi:hypothetical protein
MSPRPDVSEERKSQILEAAIEVFARLGCNTHPLAFSSNSVCRIHVQVSNAPDRGAQAKAKESDLWHLLIVVPMASIGSWRMPHACSIGLVWVGFWDTA